MKLIGTLAIAALAAIATPAAAQQRAGKADVSAGKRLVGAPVAPARTTKAPAAAARTSPSAQTPLAAPRKPRDKRATPAAPARLVAPNRAAKARRG